MATNLTYRDFRALVPLRNIFRRGQMRIRNANLHHGDIRPFACPEELCSGKPTAVELYPLRECECLGYSKETDVCPGFGNDRHFLIKANRLHEATSAELCAGDSCLAGAPVPESAPTAEGACPDAFTGTTPPDPNKPLWDASPGRPIGVGTAGSAGIDGECVTELVEVEIADVCAALDMDRGASAPINTNVTLNGTCATCTSISWVQTAGPTVALVGANTTSPSFTPIEQGTYTFEATVATPDGVATCPVTFVATQATQGVAPTVTVGAPATIPYSSLIPLSGTITPSDATAQWIQVAGPTASISNSTSATAASFTPTEPGNYQFQLIAMDAQGNVTSKTYRVEVVPAVVGVSAGTSYSQTTGTGLPLPGVVPAGAAAHWMQVSGPAATINNVASANTTFDPSKPGTYVFELTGTKAGKSSRDTIVVVVAENDLAGTTIAPQAPTVSGVGNATEACVNVAGGYDAVEWVQVGGVDADISGEDTECISFVPTKPGKYLFKVRACKAVAGGGGGGTAEEGSLGYGRPNRVTYPAVSTGDATQGGVYEVPASGAGCDIVDYAYVVTYSSRGVESAPSPASAGVGAATNPPGITVSWDAPPNGWCVDTVSIYRTEVVFEDGTTQRPYEGGEYTLIAELPADQTSIIDNFTTSETGRPLMTDDPALFPAPEGVCHLARTEDGVVVATQEQVFISYQGRPSFTFDGVVEIEDKILGIAAIGNAILVVTDNYPVHIRYVVSDGTLNISRNTIRRRLPLKSRRSMSVWGSKLFYASEYSLVAWDAVLTLDGGQSVMQELISPEQYHNLMPESIRGTAYEFGYIMSTDSMPFALMLELQGAGTDTINITSAMPITYAKAEAYATDKDGHIIYQRGDKVYRWDWRRDACAFDLQDNTIPSKCTPCCPWLVEVYHDSEGKNRLNHMRVEFDERSSTQPIQLSFRRRAFGRREDVLAEYEIVSSQGFGLPRSVSSNAYSATLEGCAILHEIKFATSRTELAEAIEDVRK